MKVEGSVVFVTGANRGLGLQFAKEALSRGAKKVYGAARDPSTVTLAGVIPVKLDVTHAADLAAAAKQCTDVTLLINNAGIARVGSVTQPEAGAVLREQIETNVFGMLGVSQAFAGILGSNGGGAMLNLLSILSWVNTPAIACYGVSKAAAWALTNGLRHELRAQGTQVVGFHAGFIDTDLTRGIDVPKATPADVVSQAFDAVEAGEEEVMVDEPTRQVKQGLSHGVYLKDVLAGG
ncbi:MAG: SDR family oxidoreductase [Paraburkholderia sp.]|uniref:SDR family oxidoreductase n=1 Tax=Paraburkholderia sp. TaxID=1926495 RepID=UPI003C434B85